jgi:predicted Fe-Mo cluster-binding NifX family protein
MKVVITAEGERLDSAVDPRFGRAAKFILYDTDSEQFQAVDNAQNLNLSQGAGIQAAETVFRLGAECLITGHCGPKAHRVLQAAGVRIFTGAQGTVAQAIEQFKAGRLTAAEVPDVEGHWA